MNMKSCPEIILFDKMKSRGKNQLNLQEQIRQIHLSADDFCSGRSMKKILTIRFFVLLEPIHEGQDSDRGKEIKEVHINDDKKQVISDQMQEYPVKYFKV